MSKDKISLKAKTEKEMPEFCYEVMQLTAEGLNNRLAELAKASQNVQDAKEGDEELEEAQLNARNMSAPYRDAKKALSMKSQYIIALAKEKQQ